MLCCLLHNILKSVVSNMLSNPPVVWDRDINLFISYRPKIKINNYLLIDLFPYSTDYTFRYCFEEAYKFLLIDAENAEKNVPIKTL